MEHLSGAREVTSRWTQHLKSVQPADLAQEGGHHSWYHWDFGIRESLRVMAVMETSMDFFFGHFVFRSMSSGDFADWKYLRMRLSFFFELHDFICKLGHGR